MAILGDCRLVTGKVTVLTASDGERVRTTPGSSCQLSLRCSELCVQTHNLATSHGASFDGAPGAPDLLQPSYFKAEFAFTEQEPRLVQSVTVGSSINGDRNIDGSCAGNALSHLTPVAWRWLPSPFIVRHSSYVTEENLVEEHKLQSHQAPDTGPFWN